MEQSVEKEIQPGIIAAPFSKEQVEALNFYQQSGIWHPFTCGYPHHELKFSPDLVAETDGWHCTISGCLYTQNWAYTVMSDRKFIEESMKFFEESARNAGKLAESDTLHLKTDHGDLDSEGYRIALDVLKETLKE